MTVARDSVSRTESLPALWFGMLGPPVIWAVRFGAAYLFVPYTCWWDWLMPLHLLTAAALLLIVVAAALSYRAWRRVKLAPGRDTTGRTRFMALFGMASSALFFIVILAEGIANLMVDPCITATTPIMG